MIQKTTQLGPPPGFRNQPADNNQNDETYKFLISFVNDLNLQPFVTQLIVKFIILIVHKFIKNITNTVMEIMVNNTTLMSAQNMNLNNINIVQWNRHSLK